MSNDEEEENDEEYYYEFDDEEDGLFEDLEGSLNPDDMQFGAPKMSDPNLSKLNQFNRLKKEMN
jgi:hypothetical protein